MLNSFSSSALPKQEFIVIIIKNLRETLQLSSEFEWQEIWINEEWFDLEWTEPEAESSDAELVSKPSAPEWKPSNAEHDLE